ncbi:MAG: hypothetical protein ACT4P3_15250 [Betaproteobacteria bacterium]
MSEEQPGDAGDGEDMPGREAGGEDQRRQHRGEERVSGARRAKQRAMADAVAEYAEEGREERAEPCQRADDHQLLHRAGGGKDVPAEDQRFHLEGP